MNPVTEVDLEKLVSLARDAGASAYDDLPEALKWAILGGRASDVAGENLPISHPQINVVKRAIAAFKI